MTPEAEAEFAAIRAEFGPRSLDRVEAMTAARAGDRHPLQGGAKWVLPGLSPTPWHDPYGYGGIAPLVHALESNHSAIRQELGALWEGRPDSFAAYEHYLTRQEDWRALYLYRDGGLVPEAAAKAPTAHRLKEFPNHREPPGPPEPVDRGGATSPCYWGCESHRLAPPPTQLRNQEFSVDWSRIHP